MVYDGDVVEIVEMDGDHYLASITTCSETPGPYVAD
jgi:hypothetical protein